MDIFYATPYSMAEAKRTVRGHRQSSRRHFLSKIAENQTHTHASCRPIPLWATKMML